MPNNLKSCFFINGTVTTDFQRIRQRIVFIVNAEFSILILKIREQSWNQQVDGMKPECK